MTLNADEGKKMKILILISHYFPGKKAGGQQRTIKNLVDAFSHEADFYIYTQNHDLNSKEPYANIISNTWIKNDNHYIFYSDLRSFCGRRVAALYDEFDVIYACGMFERITNIVMLIHAKKGYKKLYIAPMGVFSLGAMSSKSLKKKTFILVCRCINLFDNIKWSFSSQIEKNDTERVVGQINVEEYIIAEDIPRYVEPFLFTKKRHEANDSMRIIFLSRICQHKNLIKCLEVLNYSFPFSVCFDIFGSIEDFEYWEKCKELIRTINPSVNVKYMGEAESEEVVRLFSNYDVFLFPTKGENYGHVIYESLSAGCIPIVSDTTPWDVIEKEKCGFIIRDFDTDKFRDAIIQLADYEMLSQYSEKAISVARKRYQHAITDSGYKEVLAYKGID